MKINTLGEIQCEELRPLTAREKEVLRYFRDGVGYKQVGRALCISPITVRQHLSHARRALGVYSTHQAVLVDYVMQTYLGEA